jgi:cysteine desulfurase/selenocysteine lyase
VPSRTSGVVQGRGERPAAARKSRPLVVGTGVRVPVLGGGERRYINLDNAASTPPFVRVLREVNRLSRWYSNVHRGTGFKSRLSSWAYEEARDSVRRFIKAAPSDAVLFSRCTTQGINHVASRLPVGKRDVVLVSSMEHHSNDLPWRKVAQVLHIPLDAAGRIDDDRFQDLLREYGERLALVAVSGASNVTGIINPIHRYARWAHAAGALFLVDAAQLAAHRPIDMRAADDPEHLDFVVFSAHKMYAPFGAGVLAGPRWFFQTGDPYEVGGGTVELVSRGAVSWTELPDREEAGTPCILGAVALGAAIAVYEEIGWSRIRQHETALTRLALERLVRIPGVVVYGETDPAKAGDRLGVILFSLGRFPHALVSAILSHEWGIGTRSGCFCAQIYVKHLLAVPEGEVRALEERIVRGDRSNVPGAVRISIGTYNTVRDIETLGDALEAIVAGRAGGTYVLDPTSGEYHSPETTYAFGDYYRT